MKPVSSPRNPRVAAAARLRRAKERRRTGCTLVEGPKLLGEAIRGGVDLVEVFVLAGDEASLELCHQAQVETMVVERAALDRLAPTESPRGPVAVMRIPESARPRRDRLILEVTDPGNAGTLIRSAAAFGLDVGMAPRAVDAWSPKTLRAGAGAHFRTRIAQPAEPQGAGVGSIATVVAGGAAPDALPRVLDPRRWWAAVVGSEAHGIDRAGGTGEVLVTIPMPGGTESLNAAVAGSLIAYELGRWRQRVGPPA